MTSDYPQESDYVLVHKSQLPLATDKEKKRRLAWVGAILGPLLTLLALLWTMFNVEYMRYWACSEPDIPRLTQGISYCDGFEPVTVAQAEQVYTEFLGRASGADPSRAWSMLSEAERGESELERFEQGWSNILWAERVGPATPIDDRNRFLLDYRIFEGATNEAPEGNIVYFRQEVSFRDTGSDVLITDRTPEERNGTFSFDYPWVVLAGDATTYRMPGQDRQHVTNVRQGGGLRLLCQTQVADEWWTRTPLGWIANADLTVGNTYVPDGVNCENHHAEIVLADRQAPAAVTTE